MSGKQGANRLSYNQAFSLISWLNENKEDVKTEPYALLAARARFALDFPVTERNIENAIARGGFERIHPERPKAAQKPDDSVALVEIESAVGRAVSASMVDSIGSLQRYIDTSFGQYDNVLAVLSEKVEQNSRKLSEALELLKKPQPQCQGKMDGKGTGLLEGQAITKLHEEFSLLRLAVQEAIRRK